MSLPHEQDSEHFRWVSEKKKILKSIFIVSAHPQKKISSNHLTDLNEMLYDIFALTASVV
jgi:hypothetical protein